MKTNQHPQVAMLTSTPVPGPPGGRPRRRAWVAPVLAATAVVGVTAAVLMTTRGGPHAHAPAVDGGPVAGSILGSWRLVAAADGRPIPVPATPAVSITFQADGSAVIWTGVNAINLTVRYEPGALRAQFRLTTAAYDGNTDPDHLAVLRLLDALAPSAAPAPAVRSSYRIQGDDRLTIRVSSGTLEFTRDAGGPPGGTAPASSSPATPTVGRS